MNFVQELSQIRAVNKKKCQCDTVLIRDDSFQVVVKYDFFQAWTFSFTYRKWSSMFYVTKVKYHTALCWIRYQSYQRLFFTLTLFDILHSTWNFDQKQIKRKQKKCNKPHQPWVYSVLSSVLHRSRIFGCSEFLWAFHFPCEATLQTPSSEPPYQHDAGAPESPSAAEIKRDIPLFVYDYSLGNVCIIVALGLGDLAKNFSIFFKSFDDIAHLFLCICSEIAPDRVWLNMFNNVN